MPPTTPNQQWFPCTVRASDGREWSTCRVVADGYGTVVYAWSPDKRDAVIVMASTEPPVDLQPDRARNQRPHDYELPLPPADGPGDPVAVTFTHDDRCGCSHPMKRWRPRVRTAS